MKRRVYEGHVRRLKRREKRAPCAGNDDEDVTRERQNRSASKNIG